MTNDVLGHVLDQVLETDENTLRLLVSQLPGRFAGPVDGAEDFVGLMERAIEDVPGSRDTLRGMVSSDAGSQDAGAQTAQVEGLYKRLRRQLGEEALRGFLNELGRLCDAPPDPLAFDFSRPFSVDSDVTPGLFLKLGVQGSAKAEVNPCTTPLSAQLQNEWVPIPAPPANKQCVLFHFEAAIQAEASADFQVKFISLSGDASTQANAAISYYFLNDKGLKWGAAFYADLQRLATSPFDLTGLSGLLSRRELQGLVLQANGSLAIGGRMGISAPDQLFRRTPSKIGLGVGFKASRSGEFLYLITNDADKAGWVRVAVQRKSMQSYERSSAFSLEMDFTEYFDEVRPSLLEHIGKANEVVADLEKYSKPSELIRGAVGRWLKGLTGEGELQQLDLALLKIDPAKKPEDALESLLVNTIAAHSSKWDDDVKQAAGEVAAAASARLGIAGQPLANKLQEFAEELLGKWKGKADGALTDYVKKNANFKKIAVALNELGEEIDEKLEGTERRLAHARDLLKRYQDALAKLHTRVKSATALKLSLGVSSTSSTASGQETEIVLRFDPADADAADALKKVMVGQMDGVFDAVAKGGLPGVEAIGGAFSGFIERSRKSGFQFVMLDLSLMTESLLSVKTRYRIDTNGNLSVYSAVSAFSGITLPWEHRAVSFTEDYSFATGALTGVFAIGAGVAHKERRWEEEELEAFLGSVSKQGLLSSDTASVVKRYFKSAGHELNQSELTLRLNLANEEVLSMLRLGDSDGEVRGSAAQVVAEELSTAYVELMGAKRSQRFLEGLNKKGVPGDWPRVILGMSDSTSNSVLTGIQEASDIPNEFNDFSTVTNLERALDQLVFLGKVARNTAEMLIHLRVIRGLGVDAATRELDLSEAQRLVADIDKQQNEIRDLLKFWFSIWQRGPIDLFRIFGGDQIRPFTAAFLRSLVRMAKIEGTRPDLLTPVLLADKADAGDAVVF